MSFNCCNANLLLLILLVAQNSISVVLMRWVSGYSVPGIVFDTRVAVIVQESVKVVLSLLLFGLETSFCYSGESISSATPENRKAESVENVISSNLESVNFSCSSSRSGSMGA